MERDHGANTGVLRGRFGTADGELGTEGDGISPAVKAFPNYLTELNKNHKTHRKNSQTNKQTQCSEL